MQRCSLMFGLFAVMLTAAGCFNNWDVLRPEDLPQAKEILTIESPTRLLIREGEAGYLGGTILVEEDGVLNLAVEGELSVAEEAGIEIRGGRVAWTLDGILDGATFSLTNNGGGSIMLDAAQGSINIGTLNILNGDQDINSDDESSLTWTSNGMRANNMNVHNYGGTARITDAGMMQVSNMSLSSTDGGVLSMTVEGELSGSAYSIQAGGGGRVEWILMGILDCGNYSLTNGAGGSITLDAASGSIDIGNLNINSDTESTLTWTSTGMRVNNMNVQNYGGVTRITDTGTMQVNNMTLKEQYDDTASGGLTLTCNDAVNNNLTAVANGSGSALDMVLQGQVSWNNINVDANYGGGVRVDVGAEATVSFEHLYVDCSGASHGRLSNGELINAGNLTVDTFLTPEGCIYEDITDPAGPSTWLVSFPGGETFTIINTGTLDMDLPL